MVKTRLMPTLGPEGAAALHRRLTLHTIRTAEASRGACEADLEIRFTGGTEAATSHWLGVGKRFQPQGEGDLGARMSRAFAESFQEGSRATIVIGSDCPGLRPQLLERAFAALSTNRVVIGPARDGGYCLIGLAGAVPEIFSRVEWGSNTVLATTLSILARLGIEPVLLEALDDIDRKEDLHAWQRIIEGEESDLRNVSIIIPALNEAEYIAPTIEAACNGGPSEVFVVDGGSVDCTTQLAGQAGAGVIRSPPGRGRQMNAGAVRATGSVLLFLHADTLLPRDYVSIISDSLRNPGTAAGAFAFGVGSSFTGKRILEWMTNFRSRRMQLPYGDQGLFLRRSLFEELGGFSDLPIMEDYEFVSRLRRRGRVITAGQKVLTSGRRWERYGVLRVTLKNQLIVMGYHAGVSPRRLRKLY
jgi:rSAM/selenodomain-associated transferase 2/rSAM/selenodomain-associated transferase 1